MKAAEGRVLYETVRQAFARAGVELSGDRDKAILIWHDTLKELDYFSSLKPFQIVNRLPGVQMICRKAPFVRVLQRISEIFPDIINFLPRSYILPSQNMDFQRDPLRKTMTFIVKPDARSLGQGIKIVPPNEPYEINMELAVAQEYIESYLINDFKFDLRIYVLVASVSPLSIYVYREGIARFCSSPESANSIFSQLTNTAVNRKNNAAAIEDITHLVSETFSILQSQGKDVEAIWQQIDRAAVITVLSISNFLTKLVHERAPSYGLPRCFQILGFDVLLDKNLKPWILEVNYRPSLDFDCEKEKQMKIEMLASAMNIAAPFATLQPEVESKTGEWSSNGWLSFLDANGPLLRTCERDRKQALISSRFVQAYPTKLPVAEEYSRVLASTKLMPTSLASHHNLPVIITPGLKKIILTKTAARQPIPTKPQIPKSKTRKNLILKTKAII